MTTADRKAAEPTQVDNQPAQTPADAPTDVPNYVPDYQPATQMKIRLSPQAYNWWDKHIVHTKRRPEARKELILSAFHGNVFEETMVHSRNVRGVCIYLETLHKHESIFGRGTEENPENWYPLWTDNRPDHLKEYTDPTYNLQTWDDGPYDISDTSIPMRYIHLSRLSVETVNWLIDLALHFEIIPYDAYMRPYRLDRLNHLTRKKATHYISAVLEAIGLEYLTNQFLYRSDLLYDYFTQALPVLSKNDIDRYSTISPATGMPPTWTEWRDKHLTEDQRLLRRCLMLKASQRNKPFGHQAFHTLENLIAQGTEDQIERAAAALANDNEQPRLLQLDPTLLLPDNREPCRRALAEQVLVLPKEAVDSSDYLIRTKSLLRTVFDPQAHMQASNRSVDVNSTFETTPYKFMTEEQLQEKKRRTNELNRQRNARTAPMRKVERTIKKLEAMGIELDQQTIEDMYRQAAAAEGEQANG